jgi:hypothetical protein
VDITLILEEVGDDGTLVLRVEGDANGEYVFFLLFLLRNSPFLLDELFIDSIFFYSTCVL